MFDSTRTSKTSKAIKAILKLRKACFRNSCLLHLQSPQHPPTQPILTLPLGPPPLHPLPLLKSLNLIPQTPQPKMDMWCCHECNSLNLIANCPDRCPLCAHFRCALCTLAGVRRASSPSPSLRSYINYYTNPGENKVYAPTSNTGDRSR